MKKTYSFRLTNDYVYKMMHLYDQEIGKRLIKSQLKAFCDLDADDVEFEKTEWYPPEYDAKDVRFDLCVVMNGKEKVNVEMQQAHIKDIAVRAVFHTSTLFITQDNKGKPYSLLTPVRSVFLVSRPFMKESEYFEHHAMMQDAQTGCILTDKFKCHIIELDKEIEVDDVKTLSLKDKWRYFLMNYDENSENLIMNQLIESEPVFQEATEVLKRMSQHQAIRDLAIAREKQMRDELQIRYEGKLEEKHDTIMELLKAGSDDQFIMRIARCNMEEIQYVRGLM